MGNEIKQAIRKYYPQHNKHEQIPLALSDLCQRYLCSCGETLSVNLNQVVALSEKPEEFIRQQRVRFDGSDLTALRGQALSELNSTSAHSRLRGLHRDLTDADVLALSYYKATLSLLRSRGFLLEDAPMPQLYHPDSEVQEDGFAIGSKKEKLK